METTTNNSLFDAEFFPTPAPIISKMFARVSKDAQYFLEPSAGKGDIADFIKATRYGAQVDCIEYSPELAAILMDKGFTVVGYDWLTHSGVCYFDAVLMNPPFSNGDEHLLAAWDFMHDGEIVCLLNEETILNPHTERRKRLAAIIEAHGDVEFLGDCFSKAERKTSVNVAMVYLKKEAEDDRVDLWANKTQEREQSGDIGADPNYLAIRDSLGNMQHHYDSANEHMLKAFQHIRKAAIYMEANGVGFDRNFKEVLPLAAKNVNSARAEFAKTHRRESWRKVFERAEFHRWLDKKQTGSFLRDVEKSADVPFTKENVKGTLENVFLQRGKLFEQSVANVFDELTRYFKGNTNHDEGWKSNDSYKVNKKLVFPYGCTFEDRWGGYFTLSYSSSRIDIYQDLDRVLCVLAGEDLEKCRTIRVALEEAFRSLGRGVMAPFHNATESRFFDIRFFKKGTVHLVFKDKFLLDRFNKAAAAGKNWLGQETQGRAA